ncbi:hypothetical protein, unlikely [Trypanosoma congolense IL3000]|uniref:Uncharacterized protein n=1 Tax=Trypanosoma congolense (strain IL3000) TaxID=1068625 RepID=F9WG64_TRYCI|nr:hypothetical protein, unlikely [Trypanosoma congolense IL3000]
MLSKHVGELVVCSVIVCSVAFCSALFSLTPRTPRQAWIWFSMLSILVLILSWTALKALKASEAFLRCTICLAGPAFLVALLTVTSAISPAIKLPLLVRSHANFLSIVKMQPPH